MSLAPFGQALTFTPRFYRIAALCSFTSALTTLALIFLPQLFAPAEGFDGRMARVGDPAYQWRAWIYFAHPFLVFAAALAVALRIRRTASGAALVGVLGFQLWASSEAAQQALTLMAFDRWRAAYAAADDATRALIANQTAVYDGIWDALFFLLLVGFLIGNLGYARAMLRGAGLTFVVGAFYLAAAMLALLGISGELGGPVLPPPFDFWLYPLLQPLGRSLIGAWLWRNSDEATSIK